MVRICIQIILISFEGFEFAFDCFEFCSPICIRMVRISSMARICIWVLRILFEWFEFTFKCLIFGSNVLNLHSNASNSFLMVRIFIGIDRISFERSNLHSNASNLKPNASNHFECLDLDIECFESLSNSSDLYLKLFESLSND